jgi:hypothetical protein
MTRLTTRPAAGSSACCNSTAKHRLSVLSSSCTHPPTHPPTRVKCAHALQLHRGSSGPLGGDGLSGGARHPARAATQARQANSVWSERASPHAGCHCVLVAIPHVDGTATQYGEGPGLSNAWEQAVHTHQPGLPGMPAMTQAVPPTCTRRQCQTPGPPQAPAAASRPPRTARRPQGRARRVPAGAHPGTVCVEQASMCGIRQAGSARCQEHEEEQHKGKLASEAVWGGGGRQGG